MKLLKITFRNIHSLKGKHEISFEEEPLRSAGIFAITGATGSGKSTILDVISLGLYNRIPRFTGKISKSDVDKLGSVVTHFTNEAWVEVSYSTADQTYISRWEISKTRNGTWRDYDMSIMNQTTNQTLGLKKSEVPDKNEELIGLNYEQFVKSILLSQGEFARFLKSKKNERYKLLEDITGAHIYREIGRKSYEIFQSKDKEIETERIKLEGISFLSKEELASDQLKLKKYKKHIQAIQIKINQQQQERQLLSQWKEVEQEEKKIEIDIAQLFEEVNSFKAEKDQLDIHKSLLPLSADLKLLQSTNLILNNNKELLTEKSIEKSETEKQVHAAILSMSQFIGKDITVDNFMSEMAEFEKVINTMDNDIQQLISHGKQIRNTIEKVISKSNSPIALQLDNRINPIQAVSIINKRRKEIPFNETIDQIGLRKKYNESLDELHKLKEWHLVLKEYVEAQDSISKLQHENETLKEKAEQTKNNKKKSLEIITELENQLAVKIQEFDQAKRAASLEEMRLDLAKGEPCPLCGSLEHPYTLHQVYANAGKLSVEIDKLKKEYKTTEQEVNEYNTLLAVLENNIKTNSSLMERHKNQLKTIDTKKKLILSSSSHFKNINIPNIEGDIAKALKTSEEYNNQLLAHQEGEMLSEAIENYMELRDVYNSYNALSKKRQKKYQGSDVNKDADLIQNRFITANSQLDSLIAVIRKIKEDIQQGDSISENTTSLLLPKLKKIGFNSVKDAMNGFISDDQVQIFESKEKHFQQREIEIETRKREISKKKEELNKQILPAESIEELSKSIEKLQADNHLLNQELGGLEERIYQDKQRRLQHKILSEQIDQRQKENRKFELLKSYIGDATGSKFSNYAQELTLSRLLSLANVRLQGLTDRYLLDHQLDQDDLLVVDQYQGNSKRAISTLSGGETFIISLALALSLSDLASRNVRLESLFIDEGFGTLDPETLDTALNTLEKLQYESGKTIGIISHVTSLKERITTQIKVKKNSQGFSTLQLVG